MTPDFFLNLLLLPLESWLGVEPAVFVLVFARIIPLVFLLPYGTGVSAGMRIKLPVALLLSFTACHTVLAPVGLPAGIPWLFLLIKECVIGVILAFMVALVFQAVAAGGRLIDMQRGLGMAECYAPEMGAGATPLGRFMLLFGVALFFSFGGHRILLRNLMATFSFLPVDQFPQWSHPRFLETAAIAFRTFFVTALRISIPVLLVLIGLETVMALLHRTAPQIPVFLLSLPLKALLAMLFLALCLHTLAGSVEGVLQNTLAMIRTFSFS